MTDRLSIYNRAAVVHLGESPIATLNDNRPIRYALDEVWDAGGIDSCLEAGQWNFAARSQRIEYESSITPEFGFQYAFEKPEDYIRTMGVCSDEYFREPLRLYADEAGYWWADLQQLYVRFVSNDASYGLDFAKWPQSFTRYVEAYFAWQTISVKTDPKMYEVVEARVDRLLKKALAMDAMQQPSREMPRGSWSRARGRGVPGDNGSSSQLIG